MGYLTSLLQIVAAVQLSLLPAQSSSSVNVNSTAKVMLFQEVWGKSFCRTIEKLVEVVQEYPGEVEHIYSPACVPLVRCAGCCGDENLECHPTLTSNTTMQLLKIKPAEQGQEYVEMTFVEHKACECRLRKPTTKQDRWKPRNRGRKRKEKKRVKDCDKCQPPRREFEENCSSHCLDQGCTDGLKSNKSEHQRRYNMGNKRKASSEVDRDSDASSGYFSALDQTDFEDVGPTSTAAQSMPSAPQVPFIPGSHPGVSPMIVMNNLVLKQPNSVAPALKPWSLNTSLDVVPQSQLLFLQPVMAAGDCTSQSFDKQKHSRKHVPMQNTIPKITPHLDEGPSAIHKRSNHGHGGRHQRRRSDDKPFHSSSLKHEVSETFKDYPNIASLEDIAHSVEDMRVENSSSRLSDLQEPHTTTSPFSLCTDSFLASFPQKSPKTSVTQSSDVESIPEALSPSSSKRKRFCNTYNILNRSGLLGITLRTKELIRQNKRSQAQLQSLQAQTDLFLEAICSGDPKVWMRLQLILQNSGNSEETPVDSLVDSVRSAEQDFTDVGCMV
ncbi:hypothetical protein Q8A67_019371 [Cirrhinus molitorella]|uniref:Platelet-derived growth factor (PDGF) family profile domain-containing protein n=1 Tax=Cirrhinus molitorella TaxID=172907 RepID=A0AA88P719_9TELE|nr:hypothetical protein Q8A67_019371 [Cirrhinus molitorella]